MTATEKKKQTQKVNQYVSDLQWIAVKDQVPPDDTYVLVWISGTEGLDVCPTSILKYESFHDYWTDDDGTSSECWVENLWVSHWMPIPVDKPKNLCPKCGYHLDEE